MRGVSILAAAVIAIVLAGCGQETGEPVATTGSETAPAMDTVASGDSAPATTSANPCAAISAEEVSAIVGSTMVAHPGDTENDCSFRTADDNLKLIVKIVDAEGYDALAVSEGAESVAGLGDRAAWVPWSGSLVVVKGDRMLDVTYDEGVELSAKASEAEKKQRSIALAEKIVPTI